MVTNRVYKVLATNGTEAASIAASTASQFLFLKEDGTAYADTDTPAPTDVFTFFVKAPDGNLVFSDKIRIKDVSAVNKQVYTAKTEQVVTIALGTPVEGGEYVITVIDTSDDEILTQRQNKRVYTIVAASGETSATLATKFRTAINADPASIVTASGSAANVVLTADVNTATVNAAGEYSKQYTFEAFSAQASVFGYYQGFGTVTYTTAPVFGSGLFYQVRTLEQRGLGYTGVTNRTKFPVETPTYTTVPGTNYDVYVIEVERAYDSNSETFGEVSSPVSLIIPVTTTAAADFEDILEAILGVTIV